MCNLIYALAPLNLLHSPISASRRHRSFSPSPFWLFMLFWLFPSLLPALPPPSLRRSHHRLVPAAPLCLATSNRYLCLVGENNRYQTEFFIVLNSFLSEEESKEGTFRIALWRGIEVAVKKLGEGVDDKVRAFRDELALYQKIRHSNVVQFLGAVSQSSPMMIVTEYLPKGDLRAFLNRKAALRPTTAVKFALDIARGMNYLHENKPEHIIHRDLEPLNILRDDSGHLKVADFGVSKLLTVKEDKPLTCTDASCRYVALEIFQNEEYDTKVDVFSFALILQEMTEGCPPFSAKQETEVPKVYAAKERPPFRGMLE